MRKKLRTKSAKCCGNESQAIDFFFAEGDAENFCFSEIDLSNAMQ